MSRRLPQAFLFDMDGTLLDSEPLWDVSLAELARHFGGTLSSQTRRAVVGGSALETVRIIASALGVGSVDETRWASWLVDRTGQLFARGVPWRPGALEFVTGVKERGIPTALVTSSARGLTDAALTRLDDGLFDVVVCGDDVTRPKPDPQPYLLAAASLQVNIVRCVAVEDSARGIEAASASGAWVIAVPGGVHDVSISGRTVVVPDLRALSVDEVCSLVGAVPADPAP